MSNLVTCPKSRNDIIEIARLVRKMSNTKNGFFDIVKFLEHQAYEIWGINLSIVDDKSKEIEPDEYAKFLPSKKEIVVRESVYWGAINRNGMDRFTLAHELGHAILHKKQALSRSISKPPAYRDPEWQANEFASHLLCPLDEIKNNNIISIPLIYGVSQQVAMIQYNKKIKGV